MKKIIYKLKKWIWRKSWDTYVFLSSHDQLDPEGWDCFPNNEQIDKLSDIFLSLGFDENYKINRLRTKGFSKRDIRGILGKYATEYELRSFSNFDSLVNKMHGLLPNSHKGIFPRRRTISGKLSTTKFDTDTTTKI